MTAVLPTPTSLFTSRSPSIIRSHKSPIPSAQPWPVWRTATHSQPLIYLAPKARLQGGGGPHRGYCPNLRSSHLSVSSPPAAAMAAAPQGPVVTDTNHRTPRSWAAAVSCAAGLEGQAAAMLGTSKSPTSSASVFA